MRTKSWIVPMLVAGAVVAAQTQTSSQTSTSQSQNGGARGYASASASASGSSRGGGSQSASGFQNGGGQGGQLLTPNYALALAPTGRQFSDRQILELQAQEWAYWGTLAKKGFVVFAGPWREGDGGLVTMVCANDQQARSLADADPAVKAGLFGYTLRAWNVNIVNLYGPLGSAVGGGGFMEQSNSQRSSGSQQSSGGSSQTSGQTSGGGTRSGG